MNSIRNRANLIGHVGGAPTIKHLTNTSVANFSIATNYKYTNKNTGEIVTETTWHKLEVYGKKAVDFVEKYVKKGDEIAVEGRIKNDSFEDADGVKRYYSAIIVDEILLLGKKG